MKGDFQDWYEKGYSDGSSMIKGLTFIVGFILGAGVFLILDLLYSNY